MKCLYVVHILSLSSISTSQVSNLSHMLSFYRAWKHHTSYIKISPSTHCPSHFFTLPCVFLLLFQVLAKETVTVSKLFFTHALSFMVKFPGWDSCFPQHIHATQSNNWMQQQLWMHTAVLEDGHASGLWKIELPWGMHHFSVSLL